MCIEFSKQEIETVQLSLIHEPTSVIIDDKKNLYNNLLLFTVLQDPKIRNSPTEMHIFHCVKTHVCFFMFKVEYHFFSL
jgi:epidermal growth factor receptor kinase substrate 8